MTANLLVEFYAGKQSPGCRLTRINWSEDVVDTWSGRGLGESVGPKGGDCDRAVHVGGGSAKAKGAMA